MTATEVSGLVIDAMRKIASVLIGIFFPTVLEAECFEIGDLAMTSDQNNRAGDDALIDIRLECARQPLKPRG